MLWVFLIVVVKQVISKIFLHKATCFISLRRISFLYSNHCLKNERNICPNSQERWFSNLCGEGTATLSSIYAWQIPWPEEPAGLYIAKELDTTEQKQLLPLPAVLGRIIHSSELWPFFLSSTCFIKALKAESTFSKWLLDYYCYHYPQTTPFTRTCRTSEVHAGYWVRDK